MSHIQCYFINFIQNSVVYINFSQKFFYSIKLLQKVSFYLILNLNKIKLHLLQSMYGLNIHFQSFKLNPALVQKNDKIRVSITTVPELNKDAFVVDYKMMDHVHHFFTVNITEETKKIIFVFRKKSFFHNDPIIASTIIHSDAFPKENDSNNLEVKTVNILEPVVSGKKDRQTLGQMNIQFSVTTTSQTFPTFPQYNKCNFNIEKIHHGEGYSKVNINSNYVNENQTYNNSIFGNDDYLN